MAEESGPASERFNERTLKNAEKCLSGCSLCLKGRERVSGFLHQCIKITRTMCPACRAYEKVYGVPAYEKPSQSSGA